MANKALPTSATSSPPISQVLKGPHRGDYPWSLVRNSFIPASGLLHLLFPLPVVPKSLLFTSQLKCHLLKVFFDHPVQAASLWNNSTISL